MSDVGLTAEELEALVRPDARAFLEGDAEV